MLLDKRKWIFKTIAAIPSSRKTVVSETGSKSQDREKYLSDHAEAPCFSTPELLALTGERFAQKTIRVGVRQRNDAFKSRSGRADTDREQPLKGRAAFLLGCLMSFYMENRHA